MKLSGSVLIVCIFLIACEPEVGGGIAKEPAQKTLCINSGGEWLKVPKNTPNSVSLGNADFSWACSCPAGRIWGKLGCEPCFCTAEYDPVCGSDGKTYSNACVARCEGIDEFAFGECG